MKIFNIISIFLLILLVAFSVSVYPSLPNRVASHWGIDGEVNGYLPKFWAAFLVPLIAIALFILLVFLPKLDPFKKNYRFFENYYRGFILVIILFLSYIHVLVILFNFDLKINIFHAIIPGLAVLFFYLGYLLPKTKRNWFIGIRTPWTISSDLVWEKTHRLGGRLFQISGTIILISFLIPSISVWLIIIALALSVVIPIIYSYLLFSKKSK